MTNYNRKNGTSLVGPQVVDAVGAAITATLKDSFQIQTSMDTWTLEKGPLNLTPFVACSIDIHQHTKKEHGIFILALSLETIVGILGNYKLDTDTNTKVIDDAAEEISNMIYGLVKTSLNKVGYELQMNIPHVVLEKNKFDVQFRDIEKMVLPFSAAGHPCRVVIVPMTN